MYINWPSLAKNLIDICKKYKNLNIWKTDHNFSTKQKKFLTCASDRIFFEVEVMFF